MTVDFHPPEMLPEITRSRLYAAGGFSVIPGLFGAETLASLLREALAVRPTARRNALAVSDGTDGRGGSPARAFTSASGAAVQWGCFSAPTLMATLAEICGLGLAPLGGGSYSYYEHAGDFLALHRDIVLCDLSIITCLAETAPSSRGRGLLVYPGFAEEPLSTVRAAGRTAGTPVTLCCGDTVALLGGMLPHEVTPMEPGQERIVSVMCYRISAEMSSPRTP